MDVGGIFSAAHSLRWLQAILNIVQVALETLVNMMRCVCC